MGLPVNKEWLTCLGNGQNSPNRGGGVNDPQRFRAVRQIETIKFLVPDIDEAEFVLGCIVEGALEESSWYIQVRLMESR